MENGPNVETFHIFLEMLLELRSSFASEGDFLSTFLLSSLGSMKDGRNEAEKGTALR